MMAPAQSKIALLLLSSPGLCYAVLLPWALCILLWEGRDTELPTALGFTAFGFGVAAFLCSVPALRILYRSDVQGWTRALLVTMHLLWLVVGGGLLAVLLALKVLFPLFQRWSVA